MPLISNQRERLDRQFLIDLADLLARYEGRIIPSPDDQGIAINRDGIDLYANDGGGVGPSDLFNMLNNKMGPSES